MLIVVVVLLYFHSCSTWKAARAKMKLLWKQYGLVWLGTYTVLYFGMLGGIYVVFDTGLVASDVSLRCSPAENSGRCSHSR